ncbi:MAG TPA: aromatic ring-hydroxylating dioxygenase subunit alpha [Labilithrix sp.]|nr:aromatic ring-hydroxylating dioxygenase subunit alpha [Labilithrix sp.]
MNRRARPLTPDEVAPVLRATDRACPLPARAFHDDDVFAFEQAAIFGHSWICVGRVDEVALPGQWLRETVAGEPILVVRGPDLRLRAFYDVCRHRGASLVARTACGRRARLECPYHGWTYELDGRLARAPFAPASFERRRHSLREARVDLWRGFVFVRLDEHAPPLAEWLAETPPWLTEDVLASLRRGQRTTYDVDANWKLLVDNFQESHHFTRVHRALEALTPTANAQSWLTDGPWLGGTMEIRDAETVSLDGSRHDRPLLTMEEGAQRVYDAMLFPALLTSLQPDYLLTYRLTPLRASRTRVTADIYFHPAAFTPNFDPSDVYDFWTRVNSEDRAVCEDQQANVTSRAFTPACYATVEEGVHAFDRMVANIHLQSAQQKDER